ncbi:glycerophosphodiester phosphodiesterase family protein [Corynebacterium glaucum]|uniref:glycerophosphodiester phosphodiesterase family protein n=1 Tax=Corynebacterium glaucum TaxID=187491 RepID=UPI002659DBCB|nr:glycerophosphodiester phosphodiesterase family protein [Corynebacterium glaucum]
MDNRVQTQIIAHRGFSGLYPEHTQRAFEEALKLPIHGIECDVRLTRDGKLVVFHDATVNRTTNGRGRVATMDYRDLRELNSGTEEDPQHILLLDELLELVSDFPDKHIYIETKHPTRFGPEVDEQTLRVLRYNHLQDSERVHVVSFSHSAVRYFAKQAPELETYYLFHLRERTWNPGNTMFSKPFGVGPALSHLQHKQELLGFKGLKTYTWTVNTPREMLWCAENGVDVMATDLPNLALDTFERGRGGVDGVR